MGLITMILPLAYQSDRLVLSHVAPRAELAVYAVGAQFFAPVLAIIGTSGQFLWPRFASLRSVGGPSEALGELTRIWRHAIYIGLILGTVFALLLGVGVRIATGGELSSPPVVGIAFGMTLAVHTVYYPLGMYLTSADGLRFQAMSAIAMLVVNLALSISLSYAFGAAGPILGSAISITACMFLPAWLRIHGEKVQDKREL